MTLITYFLDFQIIGIGPNIKFSIFQKLNSSFRSISFIDNLDIYKEMPQNVKNVLNLYQLCE